MVVCNKTNIKIVDGGFSKAKGKKDQEKGVVHTDMFTLSYAGKYSKNAIFQFLIVLNGLFLTLKKLKRTTSLNGRGRK